MQIFNSYDELTKANNKRTSSQNVMSYFETDNTIAGAVDAVVGMDDAKTMYGGAVSTAIGDINFGNVPGAESVMEDPKVQDAREKIEEGTEGAAKELKDAEAKEEFRQTGSPDFPEEMGKVHEVNRTVQDGVKKLKTARKKLDIPIPSDVEQAAWEVQKYAQKASETNPSQYAPERHNQDKLKQAAKRVERQSRPRSTWE